MKQIIPFNQAKAGKKPLFCLQNVRLGFGIAAKYPNAITAWNNTEQHKNREVPEGLDVPLYYSWKVDGHINVRLADGRVWSDGNIYKSIADYEAKSAPVFLGWGESVNNVKVIGEKMQPITSTDRVRKIALEYTIDNIPNNILQKYVDDKTTELSLRQQLAADVRYKVEQLQKQAEGNYVPVGQLYVKK